jgi:hypothetical protein
MIKIERERIPIMEWAIPGTAQMECTHAGRTNTLEMDIQANFQDICKEIARALYHHGHLGKYDIK